MPRRKKVTFEVWYEVVICSIDPPNAKRRRIKENRLGFFSTKTLAHKHGKPFGKFLEGDDLKAFRDKTPEAQGGYAMFPRHVFTSGYPEGVGHIVKATERIDLSTNYF